MSCNRCNDMQAEGFSLDRLRSIEAAYLKARDDVPFPGCMGCIGLAPETIIDRVYVALREMPTDALMRELARRFF